MKNKIILFFVLTVVFIAVLTSCKKTNDDTVFTPYKKYTNLKVGKYIIYALDSVITRSFGARFETKSYIIKDSIVQEIKDNMERTSYKVYRYHLNPSTNNWESVNTFLFTPTETNLEYVENNLRFIKLISPVSEFNSWLGNTYINQTVYHQNSSIRQWEFQYLDVDQPKTVGSFNFPRTVTIVQYDSSENRPFYSKGFNTYDKGYEIYADTIGLVYKDVMSWEYQATTALTNCILTKPNPNGAGNISTPINCNLSSSKCDSLSRVPNHTIVCDTVLTSFYYNGYGTKQVILSHN